MVFEIVGVILNSEYSAEAVWIEYEGKLELPGEVSTFIYSMDTDAKLQTRKPTHYAPHSGRSSSTARMVLPCRRFRCGVRDERQIYYRIKWKVTLKNQAVTKQHTARSSLSTYFLFLLLTGRR